MAESVIVQLPRETLQRFQRGAGAAGKSLEDFLADRLMDAIPNLPEDVPPSVRAELDAMEQWDDSALWAATEMRLPPSRQRVYSRLLTKSSTGRITSCERERLSVLGDEARWLTLKKARAYLLLKWRGAELPSIQELTDSK